MGVAVDVIFFGLTSVDTANHNPRRNNSVLSYGVKSWHFYNSEPLVIASCRKYPS